MSEGKAPTYQVSIGKQMSQDEQIQMVVTADTKGVLAERLADALSILDARLYVMGKRVIDATQYVAEFQPEVRQAINACMGVLFGRPGAIQELQVARDAIKQAQKVASVVAEQSEAPLGDLEVKGAEVSQ